MWYFYLSEKIQKEPVMQELKNWTLVILAYIGLRFFKVKDLHSEVLTGELAEQYLYKLMRVDQVAEFITYHGLAKQFWHIITGDQGTREERTAQARDFMLAHTEFADWLPRHMPYIADQHKRQRLHLGFTQIDRMIDRDLEKSIRRRNKHSNVVRRED
jgi:hypothetical protein